MGLPSLGAWGSAPDPWVQSNRALLSKSYRSNPQGSCSGQGLSTPRPCPQEPWWEGSLAWTPGGRGAALEEWGLVHSSPAPPLRVAPFRPLPWGPVEPRL